MSYPIVYVKWADATSVDTWEGITGALEDQPHMVHSVGFLISDTPEKCIIALNIDPSSQTMSQYLIIPKPWCASIEHITPGVS